MRKSFLYLVIATLFLVVACAPDNSTDNSGGIDGPDTPANSELDVNTYSIDGTVGVLNSVAVEQYGENIYIIATPTAGVATAAEMFECEEYLYAAVSPVLVGKEINMVTESEAYTVISSLTGAVLESVSPEFRSEITGGKMTFNYSDNKAVVKAEMKFVNGVVLKFHLSAEKQVVVNKNIIKRGSEEKPLRAAFYMEENGQTFLYFTPSELYYFEELAEMATWYLYIGVDNSCIDGVERTFDAESLITFGVVDNVNASKSMEIYGDDLQGAQGRYTITKNSEGNYTANIIVSMGNSGYKVEFEGDCISYLLAPEKKTNFISYGGEEFTITGATLSTENEVYTFVLTTSNGKNIEVVALESLLDGAPHGFSQFPELSVTYNGKSYCKANGNSGTLTILYQSESKSVEIDFTDYNEITLNYIGDVTLIK